MHKGKNEKKITVRGRMEKPLLRASPVREVPRSTPRLKPPLQWGSSLRRRALGGSSMEENGLLLWDLENRAGGDGGGRWGWREWSNLWLCNGNWKAWNWKHCPHNNVNMVGRIGGIGDSKTQHKQWIGALSQITTPPPAKILNFSITLYLFKPLS